MAFWGVALKPNKPEKVLAPEGEILHLSQGCLHQPSAGKNYVQAKVDGKTYTIACLEKDKEEHTSFDLFFSAEECVLTNKGSSEVHLTGYFEPKSMSDDEVEPAVAAKAPKTSPVQAPKTSPVVAAKPSPKLEVKASPKASPKTSPKASPKAMPEPEEDDDSEFEGEEGEEEEDGLEESEEEELEEEEPPAAKKRKGETTPTAPAKKQKSGEPSGSDSAGYVGQVLAFLKKSGGKATLGDIGQKCPKPKEVPGKLKAFFDGHKDKFVVDGDSVKAK